MLDDPQLKHELDTLDDRRLGIDARLRDAVNRQRYSRDTNQIDAAEQDERASLQEMDRVMTRIRSVESKLIRTRTSD